MKAESFIRVGAGESSASTTTDTNTSFVTLSTTKRTIAEIWGSKIAEIPSIISKLVYYLKVSIKFKS